MTEWLDNRGRIDRPTYLLAFVLSLGTASCLMSVIGTAGGEPGAFLRW